MNMKSGNTLCELMSELIRASRTRARVALWAILVLTLTAGRTASALSINLTYDPDSTFIAAGLSAADIVNMKAASRYAASQFTSNFNDPINVNILVTAVPGMGTLGSSDTFLMSDSYAAIRAAAVADATTADDATVLGAGGSLPTADPISGSHLYVVSTAQAKALGLAPDDLSNDGKFTFGGGFSYTYDPANRAVPGKIDFIGVAMHEFSEIMGRIALMGDDPFGQPDYMLFDLFHYTGVGLRGLNNGPGRFFSIDNGSTLLKAFNDAAQNSGDLQDWASGSNDAFNAFSDSGVQNDLTPVDLRVMDAIGYNLATGPPSPTPTATASPTCSPSWSTGSNIPAVAVVRAVGNYFAANGLFYAIGGRSADTAGADFTQPFEYNPATNTWITKGATYPDNQVNNMACGVLTVGGTPQIYCVGGSAAGATTATPRVFSYNPVTDTITTLPAADNWPGNTIGTVLPGGFAVTGNKLYIVGGFDISTGSTAQTWAFDPTAASGARWARGQDLPVAKSYVPAAAIGGLIYTGGGSNIVGPTVSDSADSYRYDPVANTWTAIASIPRATGETRAVVINNQMWVLGGGRTAPNPSNEVDIYDPGSNAWTTGLSIPVARRNFPADGNGSSRVWLAGGYDSSGAPAAPTAEVYGLPLGCGTGTPTPTATATSTPNPTATPTILANISTRLRVETGDNVLIGGFIVTGTQLKRVIVRAIGPSLPFTGTLADPTLELRNSSGALIASNDNWRSNQEAEIIATGIPPSNDLESAIVATLPANSSAYTAIVRGVNNGTGIGVVEAYDLDRTVNSKLANISTRGFVSTGDNVMIGGTIIIGSSPTRVLFRAIGPSLTNFGVPNALQDPTIELRDGNGVLLLANNNWRDMQESEIIATGLAPSNDLESAIVMTLSPSAYTAIVRGNGNTTGVALVEAYQLQ
jgi:Kelch motif